ncbi:hypothetical protein Xinn_03883 [Xenorhabdus innexi]|uniref:Uncharacterized protein n=1 Tax=Xenorhabdus innexi TaxID=290109 RepID=A0A2G0N067_9GAMM|nr:hypothetical protein Xinn_03883 [Xenorhabdus innexi]
MAVVTQPQAAVLLIKQPGQPLMVIVFPAALVAFPIFGFRHQPERIAGQGGFAAVRGNKALGLPFIIVLLPPDLSQRVGHAGQAVILIVVILPHRPAGIGEGGDQPRIRQIVQLQYLTFRQDLPLQVAPVIVFIPGDMAARCFNLSDLLFGIIMPGGGMALRGGRAGDTGSIGQPDRVIAAAADAFNTASLRIIHIVHSRLVTV